MGLKVAVFVAYRPVYLVPCPACFVGVVVGASLNEDVRRPVLWGTLPVRHGLGRLGECCDRGRQCGFGDLGYHAAVCWEVRVCCEHPRLVGVVGVRQGQGECLVAPGYCLWVYGGRVVPEGVLGGILVRTGGSSRGLHGLRCGVAVEGDVVEAALRVSQSVSVGSFSVQSGV